MSRRAFRLLQGISFSLLLSAWTAAPKAAAQTADDSQLTETVRRTFLYMLHPEDPSQTESLLEYSRRTGVPMERIREVLIYFAALPRRPGVEGYETRVLGLRSVEVLGNLRDEEALGLLERLSRTEDPDFRCDVLAAILRIGGKDLTKFCRQVINDRRTYTNIDRAVIYQCLLPYVGVSEYPLKKAPAKNITTGESVQAEVISLYLEAVAKETSIGNINRLDKNLAFADEDYRNSYFRETILGKIAESSTDLCRQYAARELQAIRELPAEKRVHLALPGEMGDEVSTGAAKR